MRISVLGGTGYAGGHIASEAASRGHEVVSYSRSVPDDGHDGVRYETADARDADHRTRILDGADVVVVALSPRGDMFDALRGATADLADDARAAGVRFGVIGGAGSFLVEADGPAFVDTGAFQPEEAKPEARILGGVLDDLRAADDDLDWFFVSPAPVFGSYAPGERRGTYRLGRDVIVADEDGVSAISGADLAIAVVDELEQPAHRRVRFTVAY
ncbi:NAD-dependent epimerase [Luteimicrobium album]|uniref:NAD-dependent epimerase n=1 Tax=Luteimicrobium album TaxID=1054550 RepID=A0ABQ6HXF6_9MICO|nr:NAD(P)H-binding protein [Luteimicrobium album]GMA22343.1 NAD-dependent epimerase [Luteimicrobium album]